MNKSVYDKYKYGNYIAHENKEMNGKNILMQHTRLNYCGTHWVCMLIS